MSYEDMLMRCPHCRGTAKTEDKKKKCPHCSFGKAPAVLCKGKKIGKNRISCNNGMLKPCSECGTVVACSKCNGLGLLPA